MSAPPRRHNARPPGASAAGESRPAPARARGRSLSTRTRLLGWYIALLAITLVIGLLVQRTILLGQLDDDVDAQLRQEVAELNQLVDGKNPETGELFGDDIEAIFDTFLSRNVPAEGEVLFTIIDGRPHASTVAPIQLLDDADVLERWVSIDAPEQSSLETAEGQVRYLAVPVRGGDRQGVFVVTIFMQDRLENIDRITQTGALVFGTTFVIVSMLAWFTAGRVLRPITDLTTAAQSISESNWSDRIEVEGNDELARLGHTFNDMLDRLEEAFETQRELVDDAGHELRTPITIIRGHLELLSDDALDRDETLRLVMDELDRMGRMVEDLLLLAKAEQPDFLLLQPVDVDALIEDIAAKASALGDRGWDIEMNAPVVMMADEQRVTQAMMNLCRNAVEHTPEGTPVHLGSRMVGDHVWLWVTDDGPGIEPADRDRIFQRFSRGQSGRHSEGAGLGLAIVAAIMEAHDGYVRMHSVPGEGATFTLILPVDTDAEPLP